MFQFRHDGFRTGTPESLIVPAISLPLRQAPSHPTRFATVILESFQHYDHVMEL
jgi:hypothetical protein